MLFKTRKGKKHMGGLKNARATEVVITTPCPLKRRTCGFGDQVNCGEIAINNPARSPDLASIIGQCLHPIISPTAPSSTLSANRVWQELSDSTQGPVGVLTIENGMRGMAFHPDHVGFPAKQNQVPMWAEPLCLHRSSILDMAKLRMKSICETCWGCLTAV